MLPGRRTGATCLLFHFLSNFSALEVQHILQDALKNALLLSFLPQVLVQFPRDVEWNEALLLLIAEESYARRFRNFLHNSEAERCAAAAAAGDRANMSTASCSVGVAESKGRADGGNGVCDGRGDDDDGDEEDDDSDGADSWTGTSIWRHVDFCRDLYINPQYRPRLGVGIEASAAASHFAQTSSTAATFGGMGEEDIRFGFGNVSLNKAGGGHRGDEALDTQLAAAQRHARAVLRPDPNPSQLLLWRNLHLSHRERVATWSHAGTQSEGVMT